MECRKTSSRRPSAFGAVRHGGILRPADESAGLLPTCDGFGYPGRLQGDGCAMAGECCAAGGRVWQFCTSKTGRRCSSGPGSGPGCKGIGSPGTGACRRCCPSEGDGPRVGEKLLVEYGAENLLAAHS